MNMSSELQNKMLNYQMDPPEGFWSRIIAALDDESAAGLSKKLYGLEQIPAPHVWSNITNELDKEKKTIPFYKRTIIRYAAAAILLLGFFSIVFLLNKKADLVTLTDVPKKDSQQISPSPGLQNNETIKKQPEEIAADRNRKEKHSNSTINTIAYRRKSNGFASASLVNINAFIPKKAEHKKSLDFTTVVDRYMIYSDNEGHAMRLPKKMFDSFSCIDEEAICKLRILNLQRKIAATAITSDFTGMLELLSNIKENQ